MKRAFVDITLELLPSLLHLNNGAEISHIENLFEQGAVVRLHLRGDGLPAETDQMENCPATQIHIGRVCREIAELQLSQEDCVESPSHRAFRKFRASRNLGTLYDTVLAIIDRLDPVHNEFKGIDFNEEAAMMKESWIIVHQPTNAVVSPTDDFPSECEAKIWLQRMLSLGQFKLPFLEYDIQTRERFENESKASKKVNSTPVA